MEKPQPPSQQPPPDVRPKQDVVNIQPAAAKPDKNVTVPKYDLLTEGYDPAKLKKR